MAAWLDLSGSEALAVDYGGLDRPATYEAVAARVATALAGEGWTLVVHSGAGALAPSIVAALGRPAGVVFVDAVLPHPGRSWMQTAPHPLAERLRSLATDGMLPPWNLWFAADPLTSLIPNGEVRAAFTAELPFTPLAFLEEAAPSLEVGLPCAFLQLSGAYASEAAQAKARGWPTHRLDLNHLAMVTHPDKVADALLALEPAMPSHLPDPDARLPG